MSPDDHPDLDPALVDAVRRAYVRQVDKDTVRRHVSAIAAVAATQSADAPATATAGRPRRGRRIWRPVLGGGLATLLLPVGLSLAGVSLPSAVDQPYRVVGITLPHQTQRDRPSSVPTSPTISITTPQPTRPAVGVKPLHLGQQSHQGPPAARHNSPVNPSHRQPPATSKPHRQLAPGRQKAHKNVVTPGRHTPTVPKVRAPKRTKTAHPLPRIPGPPTLTNGLQRGRDDAATPAPRAAKSSPPSAR